MKQYINTLACICFALVVMAGCKKDENQVVFDQAKNPVLSLKYSGPVVLTGADKPLTAFTLDWTNPEYRFNTGISSHDVTYTIQFDTTGANFTSKKIQEVVVSKDLSKVFTVDDINKILVKMELVYDMPHNIDVRVISSINGAIKMTSNVVKLANIVPFEDFALTPPKTAPGTGELFITGSAVPSDWTNAPPAAQKLTKISDGIFEIVIALEPGKQYKFLSRPGFWQPQYGRKDGDQGKLNGDMGVNMGNSGDPSEFLTPDDPGNYKITLNFYTGKYNVVKQ